MPTCYTSVLVGLPLKEDIMKINQTVWLRGNSELTFPIDEWIDSNSFNHYLKYTCEVYDIPTGIQGYVVVEVHDDYTVILPVYTETLTAVSRFGIIEYMSASQRSRSISDPSSPDYDVPHKGFTGPMHKTVVRPEFCSGFHRIMPRPVPVPMSEWTFEEADFQF